jgi:exportin-7
MVQLLCRTIKLGWFDSDANKNIADDCKALLEGASQAHYLLGLKILNALVAEMNQPGSSRTLTQVRPPPAPAAPAPAAPAPS